MELRRFLRFSLAGVGASLLVSCATSDDPATNLANALTGSTSGQQEYKDDYSFYKNKGYSDKKAEQAATEDYFSKHQTYPETSLAK